MDSQEQQFDLVLAPNIQYTACAKGHTHHPEQWPLSGTISIDKCERQCRFPACRAWSQTAAALRKHVNAHILNNNLNMRVITASNGREPVRVTSGQALSPSASSYVPWPVIPPQPATYSPAASVPLSRDPSDSGYATRGSSTQPASFDDNPWSPKRSPEFPTVELPPKRTRTELFGEVDHHSWPGSEACPISTANPPPEVRPPKPLSNYQKSIETDSERAVYVQRLDTLLAKVQKLKEATAQASNIRKERSISQTDVTTPPDIHDVNCLPSMRIAYATATHFRELNRLQVRAPASGSQESKINATPNSSEMGGLEYHESEAENLSQQQQQPGHERRDSITTPTFCFDNSDFSDRLPERSPQGESISLNRSSEDWTPGSDSQQNISELSDAGANGHHFSSTPHEPTENPSGDFARGILSAPEQDVDYRDRRLQCNTCHNYVKTKSELKKHDLRHTKPYHCEVVGCPRTEGFSTPNDLERHTRVKHSPRSTSRYRCRFPGCKSENKVWPRLDNFRSHLKRVHGRHLTEGGIENIVRSAQFDSAIADIVEQELHTLKPHSPGSTEHVRESHPDLQSLHVLADSAVFGRYHERSRDMSS